MSQRIRRFAPAFVIASLGLAASSALAAEPTATELKSQIEALQTKVSQLEATQTRDEAVSTANIQRVLADADKHSKMLDLAGVNGGYDPKRGLFMQSEDGNNYVHLWLQFQPRYEASYQQHAKNGGDSDSTQNGFEIRRMKFGVDGNLFTKDLTFAFQYATDRFDGEPELEDAWAKYAFSGGPFAVRGGQFKDPFAHESLVGGKKLLSAERSYIGDILGNGDNYVQGLSAIYDPNSNWRAEVAFTDGVGSANTNFQNSVNGPSYGVAGRFEYQVWGQNFNGYEDFTALNQTQDMLVVGFGADYTEGRGTNTTVNFNDAAASDQSLLGTADIQYENANGLGAYAAFIGRYRKIKNGTFDNDGDAMHNYGFDYGVMVQASYLFNPQWEVFGRYSYLYVDTATTTVFDEDTTEDIKKNVNEITAGVNYYIHGHAAKFTADITYLPNGAPITDSGAGIIANSGSNEVIGRVQFQLLI